MRESRRAPTAAEVNARVLLVLLCGLLCAWAASCKSQKLGHGCQQDKDCGTPEAAFRCETQTGECFCRTDDACAARQYCNPAGFCQDRSGCTTDTDCTAANQFCDTSTNTCLDMGRCTSDLHCALGQVCDLARSSCVDGCHFNGDCAGSSCRCGDLPCSCTGETAAEIANCQVGTCDPYFCSDNTFCKFGEECGVPPDAGIRSDSGMPRNRCYSDFDIDRRPYCATCTYGAGINTCGTGANFCIIDTRTNSTYCGADCSEGQQCPRGYGCRDIRIVYTRWLCSASQACPPDPTLPCTADGGCARGGECVIPLGASTGFCAGQCRIREGSSFGYCSCQVDFDCPQESCTMGECSITRRKCDANDPNACRQIKCVDFDGVGGCLIGQNCTPSNGLTCLEVQ